MDGKQIKSLMSAYGLVPTKVDEKSKLTRFQAEERNVFVDVWNGKKGTTVGAYNPHTRTMQFLRRVNMSKLEDVLVNSTKEN